MDTFVPHDFSFDLEKYPLILEYDPEKHPQPSKDYPYERVRHRRLTRDEFILIALWVHGKGRYDYSDVEYHTAKTPITIKCNETGIAFTQTPNAHTNANGKIRLKMNTSDWLRVLFEKYPEKKELYDWSRVEINSCYEKIEIGCKACGKWFKQRYRDPMNGCGCPFCRGFNRTTEESIRNFKRIHSDTYIYTKWKYSGSNGKGTIVCRAHGEFTQSYKSHMKGRGCPLCAVKKKTYSEIEKMPKEEKDSPYFLYHVRFIKEDLIFDKIGVCKSGNVIETRFRDKAYKDFEIQIIDLIQGRKEDILIKESEMLDDIWKVYGTNRRFYDIIRTKGFHGITECFYISDYNPPIRD